MHIEAFLAIFVCFVTKAVHLELVSDQTTESYLASMDRFIDRRGVSLHFYSDNGSNYTGAKNQLENFYDMINSRMLYTHIASTTEARGTTATREPPTLEVSGRQQ